MRVLHIYPKNNSMITSHVFILKDAMPSFVETTLITSVAEARKLLATEHFDILHLHGCWNFAYRNIFLTARKGGTRMVMTPHGQLEPWIRRKHLLREKLPKTIIFQKEITSKAYAVIVMGRIERECMQQLAWNPRIETVRNSVYTQSISNIEMARQTYDVYQKVMDSNTIENFSQTTHSQLRNILKAGITGDKRWAEPIDNADIKQWRELMLYACQEQIYDVFIRGTKVLALVPPDFDPEKAPCYMPARHAAATNISQTIGNSFVNENERLVATFRQMKKLYQSNRLTILHVVELDREIREHPAVEDELLDTLQENHLDLFAARMMTVAQCLTGLDEGMMVIPSLSDKQSQTMINRINKNLEI